MMYKVTPLEDSVDLSNEHHPPLGPFDVVDVKFASHSIFTKRYRHDDFPTIQQLCGFVMREDYPLPENVQAVRRYDTVQGAVYRIYIRRSPSSTEADEPDFLP